MKGSEGEEGEGSGDGGECGEGGSNLINWPGNRGFFNTWIDNVGHNNFFIIHSIMRYRLKVSLPRTLFNFNKVNFGTIHR